MNYKQLIKTITELLESCPLIKTVKNATPKEWLFRTEQPIYPVAFFSVNNGSLNVGEEQVYNVQFFYLDKSGMEAEFENDVVNTQISIGSYIIDQMRTGRKNYTINDAINFNVISDKYEDYLAGIEYSLNITTESGFPACETPLN